MAMGGGRRRRRRRLPTNKNKNHLFHLARYAIRDTSTIKCRKPFLPRLSPLASRLGLI